MSKSALYLIVVIALAATAATFFVTKPTASIKCMTGFATGATQVSAEQTPTLDATSYSVKPIMRGFPFSYYREPLPNDCVPQNMSFGSTFNTAHLAYDLLIWLAVAFLLFLPSTLLRMWRGPRMLGDFKGRA